MEIIESTNLWRSSLSQDAGLERAGLHAEFTDRLRHSFVQFRNQTSVLVGQIESSFKALTVHKMEHIDALWQCADLLLGNDHGLNPTEVFVLGGAFLLHDAGLALASYPGGIAEIQANSLWRDCASQEFLRRHGRAARAEELAALPADASEPATEVFLRLNHAANAVTLGTAEFRLPAEDTVLYLIEDSDLRLALGTLIGAIAFSHWWPVEKVLEEFQESRGGFPGGPAEWSIDPLRIAVILRAADAIQIDSRRAPAFRRALRKPSGDAEKHWHVQGNLLAPLVEQGAVKFASSRAFRSTETDAWWLGQELLTQADAELRGADRILQEAGRQRLTANHVKGASSVRDLATFLRVDGWTPVAANVHVSDVAQVVERLGGKQLYGDTPRVALRELIKNARDAIVARRLKHGLADDWGQIRVELLEDDDTFALRVSDCGVGMSESTLAGALLDFGNSYWQSPAMLSEHPGLAASGFEPTGQFGIGFYSVFLLGDCVKVVTRRPEDGQHQTRVLEFQSGVRGRTLIRPASPEEELFEPGTTVSVRLKTKPEERSGLLAPSVIHTRSCPPDFRYQKRSPWQLSDLCEWLAPALDVTVITSDGEVEATAVSASDWESLTPEKLLRRLYLFRDDCDEITRTASFSQIAGGIRAIRDDTGRLIGRATLVDRHSDEPVYVASESRQSAPVTVTAGGFRSSELWGLSGILIGKPTRATRSQSEPVLSSDPCLLASWATEQATIVVRRSDDPITLSRYAGIIRAMGGTTGPLPIFRFRGELVSFDELATATDLPSEIELVQDAWGVADGNPDLADNQIGVCHGRTRAAGAFNWMRTRVVKAHIGTGVNTGRRPGPQRPKHSQSRGESRSTPY